MDGPALCFSVGTAMASLYYLYAIRLPVNDYAIAYIGVSKKPARRFGQHIRSGSAIGQAIKLCGQDNAILQPLACGSREFIYDLEIKAIAAFSTRTGGYNQNAGGFGCRTRLKIAAGQLGRVRPRDLVERINATNRGRKQSAEQRAKSAERMMGERNPNWHKTPSLETRQRIAATLTGRPGHLDSFETRQKKAEANRGEKNHGWGKPRPIEVRQRIATTMRGRAKTPEHIANAAAARWGAAQ